MKLAHITADTMKLALLIHYRFNSGASYCVTECGRYSSDVMVVKGEEILEFETKISLADFKADFAKEKHRIYEHATTSEAWDTKKFSFVPHKFYFVVPQAIVASVLPKLIGKPYGVIAVQDIPFKALAGWVTGYMKVVKRAQSMRSHPVTDEEKLTIVKRMSSELINSKIKNIKEKS